MKHLLISIIILSCWWFVYADYSYTKWSVCTWDQCSTQTCHVTEYDEQVITSTQTYTDTEVISDLYDYLIAQWEDVYADRLMHLLDIQCIEKKAYTVSETKTEVPSPTEECERSQPICGNGVVDAGEECDKGSDKNWKEWISCTHDCMLSDEFDVNVYDPVLCDGHFEGGIDLPSGDYDNVSMHLDIMCEGDTEYTSLNPVLNDEGEYVALLNYTDQSASNFKQWACNVRYGGTYKWITVEKTATEYLQWWCKEWWWPSSWSSDWPAWWSKTWSSGWSNWGPIVNEDGSITVFSTISSPIWWIDSPKLSDPVQGPIDTFHSTAPVAPAGDSALILDPAAPHLAPPRLLEKTWAWWFRWSVF